MREPGRAASPSSGTTPRLRNRVAVKLSLDYSLPGRRKLVQLKELITKATPRRTKGDEPLRIKGNVEDGGGAFGAAAHR